MGVDTMTTTTTSTNDKDNSKTQDEEEQRLRALLKRRAEQRKNPDVKSPIPGSTASSSPTSSSSSVSNHDDHKDDDKGNDGNRNNVIKTSPAPEGDGRSKQYRSSSSHSSRPPKGDWERNPERGDSGGNNRERRRDHLRQDRDVRERGLPEPHHHHYNDRRNSRPPSRGGERPVPPGRYYGGGGPPPPPYHHHRHPRGPPPGRDYPLTHAPHFDRRGGPPPEWWGRGGGDYGGPHGRGGVHHPAPYRRGEPFFDEYNNLHRSNGGAGGVPNGVWRGSNNGSRSSHSASASRSPRRRHERRRRGRSRSRSASDSSYSKRSSRTREGSIEDDAQGAVDDASRDSSRSRSRSASPNGEDKDPTLKEHGHSDKAETNRRSGSRSSSARNGGKRDEGRSISDGHRRRKRDISHDRDRDRDVDRKRSRRQRGRDDYSSSAASSSSSYSSASTSPSRSASDYSEDEGRRRDAGRSNRSRQDEAETEYSKNRRTVFVSQLVMRTTERDIRRYFKKKLNCKVNEVILLKDKRTGNHKGCAYVQFGRIEDVATAVAVSGQPPDFQRFPLLIKASEAEKNYALPAGSALVPTSLSGAPSTLSPLLDKDGNRIESQKVYVGGLDPTVTEEHLFALFSQFGHLEKVSIQIDPATNCSRGYAFLAFRDPKDANLAIQTMSSQILAGRPIKTGWANQASSVSGVRIVTSDEFPADASAKAQRAFAVLGQLMGVSSEAAVNATMFSATAEKAVDAAMGQGLAQNVSTASPAVSASAIPTVAEARASMAAAQQAVALAMHSASSVAAAAAAAVEAAMAVQIPNRKFIGNADTPTRHLLVHNMYDKDEETDPGWEKDIKEEFSEECSKFGKIEEVTVMHEEPGGKIYATFETTEAAKSCAANLAGRWFDKRQLRVDFVQDNDLPTIVAPVT